MTSEGDVPFNSTVYVYLAVEAVVNLLLVYQ